MSFHLVIYISKICIIQISASTKKEVLHISFIYIFNFRNAFHSRPAVKIFNHNISVFNNLISCVNVSEYLCSHRVMSMLSRVQILDKAVCISYSSNIFGKGMNPTILLTALTKSLRKPVLKKKRTLNSNLLNSLS